MIIGSESDISVGQADIWQAWCDFKKGKKKSAEFDAFTYSPETNLFKLYNDLNDSIYRHGSYRVFRLTDTKKRTISVASIRDRTVHRLIYDYLISIFDKRFIYDVWSCRKGKGLLGAIERTQRLLGSNRYGNVWRSDITKFFDSVDHTVLKSCIQRRVSNQNAINLINNVINSFTSNAPDKGIPIGNLTSQIFCNIYLHELDHYISHTIRPRAYLRYGDDFIVIVEKQHALEGIRKEATKFIEQRLKLTVNKNNNIIIPVRHSRLNLTNSASYRSLILTHTRKKKSSRAISNKVKWIDWKLVNLLYGIK